MREKGSFQVFVMVFLYLVDRIVHEWNCSYAIESIITMLYCIQVCSFFMQNIFPIVEYQP